MAAISLSSRHHTEHSFPSQDRHQQVWARYRVFAPRNITPSMASRSLRPRRSAIHAPLRTRPDSCPGVRCCAAHPWLRRVPARPASLRILLRSRSSRYRCASQSCFAYGPARTSLFGRSPQCCSPCAGARPVRRPLLLRGVPACASLHSRSRRRPDIESERASLVAHPISSKRHPASP